VRESTANTEAEDTVGIHHQAIPREDKVNCKYFKCAVVTVISRVGNSVRLP
jgi:hypothetical protein